MVEEIQEIKNKICLGVYMDTVIASIVKTKKLDRKTVKEALKGVVFQSEDLQQLIDNLADANVIELLQKVSKVSKSFTILSYKPFEDLVLSLLQNQKLFPDHLQYLDTVVKTQELAKRIVSNMNPIELATLDLKSFGEISWLLLRLKRYQSTEAQINAVLNWITQASKKKQNLSVLKAQEFIKHLGLQLCLTQRSFAALNEARFSLENTHTSMFLGDEVYRLIGKHQSLIRTVKISQNQQFIVSGGYDKCVKLWNLKDQSQNCILGEHDNKVLSVCISNDNNFVVSTGSDGQIKYWNLLDSTQNKTLGKHCALAWSVCISKKSDFVVSAGSDKQVKLWYLEGNVQQRTVAKLEDQVLFAELSSSERFIVAGGADKTVWLISLDDQYSNRQLGSHEEWVQQVKISQQENFVISCSRDKTIKLWHLMNSQHNRQIGSHRSYVWAIEISENGSFVISCGLDCVVMFWDLIDEQRNRVIQEFPVKVQQISLSKNNDFIAVVLGDFKEEENLENDVIICKLCF